MNKRAVIAFFICLIFLSGCDSGPMSAGVSMRNDTETKSVETTCSEDDYNDIIDEFTDDQILSAARDLYVQCLAVTDKYKSGCVYDTDISVTTEINDKTFYMVSDSRINTFEDIYSEWMSVFNQKYFNEKSDIFSLYLSKDDKVWVCSDPCEVNSAYIDTVLVKVISRKENEAEIQAVSSYQQADGISKSEDVFSVIYSSNTFRAGKFNSPY